MELPHLFARNGMNDSYYEQQAADNFDLLKVSTPKTMHLTLNILFLNGKIAKSCLRRMCPLISIKKYNFA